MLQKTTSKKNKIFYIFPTLTTKKYRLNQLCILFRKQKKKIIYIFFLKLKFESFLSLWLICIIEDKAKQALAKMTLESK